MDKIFYIKALKLYLLHFPESSNLVFLPCLSNATLFPAVVVCSAV